MPNSDREYSSDEDDIEPIITQINLIRSNYTNKLREIDSAFDEKERAFNDELQIAKQIMMQKEQEHMNAIRDYQEKEQKHNKVSEDRKKAKKEEKQLMNETILPYLNTSRLSRNREPASKNQDSTNHTENTINVIELSESESQISPAATGEQRKTPDQDGLGAIDQPTPRSRRRRRPALAEHTEDDNMPQSKKARRGKRPASSADTTSRVDRGNPQRNDQVNSHEVVEPSASTSVSRKKVDFQGITDPIVGEIYKIEDRRTKDGYAVVVLPLDNFEEIGIWSTIWETDLIKSRGPRDFEETNPMRRFPCMEFRDDLVVPLRGVYHISKETMFRWVSPERLRPADQMTVETRGYEQAHTFRARLKLIREKRASENDQASTITNTSSIRHDTDGQGPRDTHNVPSADKSPEQPAVGQAPREDPQVSGLPGSRRQENPRQGQTVHVASSSNELSEPQLRTLEEINRQNPDSAEPECSSERQYLLPQNKIVDAIHWLSGPVPNMTSLEEAANTDWGNVAALMTAAGGPHGLEATTPKSSSHHNDADDDSQTLQASDDVSPPVVRPEGSETAVPSAPDTSARGESSNQANPVEVTLPRPVGHSVGQERGRGPTPSRLRNTAAEVLRLGRDFRGEV
ncbi:hypothetical protein GGR53DRAFT_478292 [Hypoxylon sp. FL1150]|nr:hypothetical protein GGR53DRAFT_478292 [Hypoxylon sp. FL1150]